MPPCRVRRLRGLACLVATLLAGCGAEEAAAPAPPSAPDGPVSAFEFVRFEGQVLHDVPLDQVRQGVPTPRPRDAIPALLAPQFVPASQARHVPDDAEVLVLAAGGEAHVYPLRILDAHELVNDVVGGEPLLATWCPLCRSAMAFERRVAGSVRTFGVSGYLYRSAVLMYDHQSETFWSQIAARAVVGPLTGTALVQRPCAVMRWRAARERHPEAQVLAPRQEGRPADAYARDPYAAYHAHTDTMFPVDAYDRRLPRKVEVVGVLVGPAAHAVELAWLAEQPGGRATLRVGAVDLTFQHDRDADRVEVLLPDGAPWVHLRCYWFAWFAFHQATGLTQRPPR